MGWLFGAGKSLTQRAQGKTKAIRIGPDGFLVPRGNLCFVAADAHAVEGTVDKCERDEEEGDSEEHS